MIGDDVEFEEVVLLGLFSSFTRDWFGETGAAVLGWMLGFGIAGRGREFCTSGDGAGQISSVHHS